jgi:hypothetical protein
MEKNGLGYTLKRKPQELANLSEELRMTSKLLHLNLVPCSNLGDTTKVIGTRSLLLFFLVEQGFELYKPALHLQSRCSTP